MSTQNPNAITLPATADNQSFSLALQDLTGRLMQAAAENIDAAIEGSDAYTELERRSMIAIEALRLTNGMDLATILTRGQIISQIETEGLVSVHPNQYTDLSHMAREQGISVSELSDTKALCETIFPFIVEELGLSLAETWAQVGKSAFRELTPALRSIITGEQATHQSVRTAVATLLDQAAAQLIANGDYTAEEIQDALGGQGGEENTAARETVRRTAVESLLHAGATLPSRELRRTIRPSRTPNLNAVTLNVAEDQWFAVLKVESQDQLDMLVRLWGTHVDNMMLNGQGADRQIRTLRSFFGD